MTSQTPAMQIADFDHRQPGQRLDARLNFTVHNHGLLDQIAPLVDGKLPANTAAWIG